MLIDNNRYFLCLAAYDDANPTYAEFYRVDGVLALQHAAKTLTGHPGMDLPTPDECGEQMAWFEDQLRPAQVASMRRWLAQGKHIAFRYNAGGSPRIEPRDGAKYLTAGELAWLKAYCQTSFIFSQERAEREAVGRCWAAIAEIARAAKPTKTARRKATRERRQRPAAKSGQREDQWTYQNS